MRKTVIWIIDVFVLNFASPLFFRFWKGVHYVSLRCMGVGNYDEKGKLTGEDWVLNKILRRDSIHNFFDIGANQGQNSILVKDKLPAVIVYAFEAHPKTYSKLVEIASEYNTFNVYNLAVGNDDSAEKHITIYDYADNDGSEHASVMKEVFSDFYQTDKIVKHEVELISLRHFCQKNGIVNISFLKIDTEGSELNILRGLGSDIQVDFIQFEFNIMNLGRNRFYDFWFLLHTEFEIYRLLPKGLAHIKSYVPSSTEIYDYQNFLAIRKGIKL